MKFLVLKLENTSLKVKLPKLKNYPNHFIY